MTNPKVLIFCNYYTPGFRGGGPIRTISNLVNILGHDFDFYVVTADRDIGDAGTYKTVKRYQWTAVGLAGVFYVASGMKGIWKISSLLKMNRFDVLYLNGCYSFQFSIFPLLAMRLLHRQVPIILGPRGEFSSGALGIKPLKKNLFFFVARLLGIYKDIIWHASTAYEATDIRKAIGDDALIRIAVDLATAGENVIFLPRVQGAPLRVVFISRISPKKNLLGALVMLRGLVKAIQFDVYGPLEDEGYWGECCKAAELLPANVVFSYCGSLTPEKVADTLAGYDLFFFPTLGENYGHVIAEAISAGVPVLLSDTTPWRNLEQKKLGWDIPLGQSNRFVSCIEECCEKPVEEYGKWRREIRSWAVTNIGNEATVDENRQLFSNLV